MILAPGGTAPGAGAPPAPAAPGATGSLSNLKGNWGYTKGLRSEKKKKNTLRNLPGFG